MARASEKLPPSAPRQKLKEKLSLKAKLQKLNQIQNDPENLNDSSMIASPIKQEAERSKIKDLVKESPRMKARRIMDNKQSPLKNKVSFGPSPHNDQNLRE